MKIRNLRQDGAKWTWDIQRDKDSFDYDDRYEQNEFPNRIAYETNNDGEGVWMERQHGIDIIDGNTYIHTDMDQILGTCQFDMSGCHSYSSAYNKIRRELEYLCE